MRKRIFLFLFVFLLLGGSVVAWFGYRLTMKSNFVGHPIEFIVDENTEIVDIVHAIDSGLVDPKTFKEWASFKELGTHLKYGRYVFEEGMSNREMVNRLIGGLQTPSKLQFHNVKNMEQLAAALDRDLRPSKADFLEALENDSLWVANGIEEKAHRMAYIIPNTYEVYWTASAEDVVSRLLVEHGKYWTEEREEQAQSKGLTPIEVSILASIVQGETYMEDEMPIVAGLYLNRMQKGIRLQCDATSKFAWEQDHPEDYPVRRVLTKMIEYDHPYNTYLIEGLPPGPISIPELVAVEAVLNADNHEYIFMMADLERPGYHNFAKTLAQHERNIREYRIARGR
ncbi:MAG: endolytic transglycosylase MltG [Flavobacteriia bacterium]|nr:endolytic transglycosylase MltG [Flavobacteriia bacterium]